MKQILLERVSYYLKDNYKEGFDLEAVQEKYTDYFEPYDYIVGDWSYGKLRLKGFCNRINQICNHMNDVHNLENYVKEMCAYECRYFVLEKEQKNDKDIHIEKD